MLLGISDSFLGLLPESLKPISLEKEIGFLNTQESNLNWIRNETVSYKVDDCLLLSNSLNNLDCTFLCKFRFSVLRRAVWNCTLVF